MIFELYTYLIVISIFFQLASNEIKFFNVQIKHILLLNKNMFN